MASGSWVKMRVLLRKDPKVSKIASFLADQRGFMDWLTDPVQQSCKESAYDHVTAQVLRSIVVASLLEIWGVARERGDRVGDDLILDHCTLFDLDEICGTPYMGMAMEEADWAEEFTKNDSKKREVPCIKFPKFFKEDDPPESRYKKQHAEAQARYRAKKNEKSDNHSDATSDVTSDVTSDCHCDITVTHREEKNREENKEIVNTNLKDINSLSEPKTEKFAPILENPVMNLFTRYMFRRYGNLPNLEKPESKTVLKSIQDALAANTATFSLLDEYLNKPPPERPRNESIASILTFLGVTGRSLNYEPRENSQNGKRPCGGGRWETFTPRHVSFS